MTIEELLATADTLQRDFEHRCHAIADERTLEQLRIDVLGRKGTLPHLRSQIKSITSGAERKRFGEKINTLHKHIELTINTLRQELLDQKIALTLKQKSADIDLPVLDSNEIGSLHPVSLLRAKLEDIFHKLGFSVQDGPDTDFEDYNFNKLNIPEHHPARDMQDTFYLQNYPNLLLRTHTSNVQIHAMEEHNPPMRIVSMGRCFRCDYDLTHTPMFHQIEGFVIDEGIGFSHLKGTINVFLRQIYGIDIKTRFRPSFFPFVEPGAEVDMGCVSCKGRGCRVCKETGWLEVGGCGMIHPNVFEAMNIDSESYTGFAFGFGIDRLAMLYFGITDLRMMFAGQTEFLSQFPTHI